VTFFFPDTPAPRDRIQSRLFQLAAVFLLLYATTLTLSPAVRLHSWQVSYRWTHWIGLAAWMAGFELVHRVTCKRLTNRDPYILPAAALLTGIGLMTIWRLDTNFGTRQTIWLIITLGILTAGFQKDEPLILLRRYKYMWLTGGLVLLALTFIFGTYPGGAGPRLWLGCCGIYLQPSEPLKLLLIVYLSAYLADRMPLGFGLIQLMTPTLLLMGTALTMLVAQRDLGTVSLFLIIYFTILYVASGRKRLLGLAAVILIAAGLLGYNLFSVIRIRVDALIDPWLDPSGSSYQIVQSLISVASGQIIGRGPGLGSPSVVPVAHSDFIFAAIMEESGLAGGAAILLLIGLISQRGLLASLRAPNNFQRYLSAGLTFYLAAQSLLIIGGNIRVLPLTGVTLPFVSYGGSSLVTAFISMALLLSVSSNKEEETAPLQHPSTYRLAGMAIFTGLAVFSLFAGWWTIIRSENLIDRADNPRRIVDQLYVQRGTLVDRTGKTINYSSGEPGSYQRIYNYPGLSLTAGYTHSLYGQTSLEASLDEYLRGVQGNPTSLIWSSELLYGQPPAGLDVRLSLDVDLQSTADELLKDKKGAAVLLNARTGEILVMASHPNIDPNNLDLSFSQWSINPDAPLLNRATQGLYPPGSAFGTFLLSANLSRTTLPILQQTMEVNFQEKPWGCSGAVAAGKYTWNSAIQNGCPGAVLELGKQLSPAQLMQVYRSIGFTQTPENFPMPLAAASTPENLDSNENAVLGQGEISVSPLQMALAAAAISAGGTRPSPMIALAVNTPHQGWVVLPSGQSSQQLSKVSADKTAEFLTAGSSLFWQSAGSAFTKDQKLTWFTGGTIPDWKGSPLAVVVLLEEDNPSLAYQIGRTLLEAATTP